MEMLTFSPLSHIPKLNPGYLLYEQNVHIHMQVRMHLYIRGSLMFELKILHSQIVSREQTHVLLQSCVMAGTCS